MSKGSKLDTNVIEYSQGEIIFVGIIDIRKENPTKFTVAICL